jgi:hypothetical protein
MSSNNTNISDSTEVKVHCMICLDNQSETYVHGPCNHLVTCGNCYLLNKMKYEKNICVLCFEPLRDPIVTTLSDSQTSYSDYNLSTFGYSRKIGCYFQDRMLLKKYESKLNYTCSQCSLTFNTMHELKRHASDHNKEFCNICLNKRKVFPIDQRLYSNREIGKHRTNGDPPIGIEGAIPAHVKCNLCRDWSYDRDDYVHHMIMNHHCCQLCKRRGTEVWLLGQTELTAHYASDHLVCDFEECCAKPLENVYEDEIALQSHILAVHGKSVSKQERKAAARINLDFTYARPASSSVSTSERISHQVGGSNSSVRPSTSATSLAALDSNHRESSSVKLAATSHDIMTELQTLLGSNFAAFRSKCLQYYMKEISASDFYEEFCERLLGFPSAPLLWIQLVDSLPDFNLRDQLHRAHHDAVKVGKGLNRKAVSSSATASASSETSAAIATTDPPLRASLPPPPGLRGQPAQPRNIWENGQPSLAAVSAPTTTASASARPKAKGPSKGGSVWATPSNGSQPAVIAAPAAVASVSQASVSHLNSTSGWPREAFSMTDFPRSFGKKKPTKPMGSWAAAATNPVASIPAEDPRAAATVAILDEDSSSKKKGKPKKVLMQIGLRLNR